MQNEGSQGWLSNARRQRWRAVQGLVIADNFLRMLHFASNMTEALNLAQDVGQDAMWSGLLIGSAWALSFVGALVGWRLAKLKHSWISTVVTLTPGVTVAITMLYILGAKPPSGWWHNEGRKTFLLTSRLLFGLVSGVQGVLLNTTGARVTPASQMVEFETYKQCARALGLGGGPLLSAFCSHVAVKLGVDTVGVRSALPGFALMTLWLMFFHTVFQNFPKDLASMNMLLTAKASEEEFLGSTQHGPEGAEDQQAALSESVTEASPLLSRSSLFTFAHHSIDAKKCVVLMGMIYGIMRALTVSSLESATSYIVETEFHYDSITAGLAVGSTFLSALPLVLLVSLFRGFGRQNSTSNSWLLYACTSTSCLASLLLVIRNSHTILAADAVIFPTCYLASSITDGLALANTVPGTLFSAENYVMVDQIAQNAIARLVAPVAARYLIKQEGGQSRFAMVLFLLSLSGCCVCWLLQYFERARSAHCNAFRCEGKPSLAFA